MSQITGYDIPRALVRDCKRIRRQTGSYPPMKAGIPDRIYKYVDAGHASVVERGSVRVGLFSQYREDKTSRGDRTEGLSSIEPVSLSLKRGEGAEHRQGMAEIGMHCHGDIEMHGAPGSIRFRTAGSDWYCVCFSLVPDSPTLLSEGNQAVFEIRDPIGYMHDFMQCLGLASMFVGPVIYEGREFTAFDQPGFKGEDPFRKARWSDLRYHFEEDEEFRLVMPLTANLHVRPYPEKRKLARHMRRII